MSHVLAALKIVPKTQSDDAVELAKELGLALQARRYEKPLAENAFTALTADEVTLWRHHCPTAYVATEPAEGKKSLAEYGFDSIPVEVMRHWKSVKDIYNFDSFEIWTTERTRVATDPLLIGIIGAKLYLLARWGMESPEHLPLKELAQKALERVDPKDISWMQEYPDTYSVSLAAYRMVGFPVTEKKATSSAPNFLQKMLGMEHNEP